MIKPNFMNWNGLVDNHNKVLNTMNEKIKKSKIT